MATQFELDLCYLQVAQAHAKLSKAKRSQVGACLVTPEGVILGGVNGTPSGTDNLCEINDITLPNVIHAELNCLLKAARQGVSVKASTMYLTLSPCESCAAMLLSAGVKRVVFLEEYRINTGILYLMRNNIEVIKFNGDINDYYL